MYQSLYELIVTYIYNGAITEGSFQDLVAIEIATICSIFLALLPMILIIAAVWKILK